MLTGLSDVGADPMLDALSRADSVTVEKRESSSEAADSATESRLLLVAGGGSANVGLLGDNSSSSETVVVVKDVALGASSAMMKISLDSDAHENGQNSVASVEYRLFGDQIMAQPRSSIISSGGTVWYS